MLNGDSESLCGSKTGRPECSPHQPSDPLVNSRNARKTDDDAEHGERREPHRDELQDEDVHPRTADLIECR